jgi:hypothetical protein
MQEILVFSPDQPLSVSRLGVAVGDVELLNAGVAQILAQEQLDVTRAAALRQFLIEATEQARRRWLHRDRDPGLANAPEALEIAAKSQEGLRPPHLLAEQADGVREADIVDVPRSFDEESWRGFHDMPRLTVP